MQWNPQLLPWNQVSYINVLESYSGELSDDEEWQYGYRFKGVSKKGTRKASLILQSPIK